jgi:alpha-methylacyl-CoA racemase
VFASRARDDWAAAFDGSDACVAPVLDFAEAPKHPQHLARAAFVEVGGLLQPAPAPRFSRTPAATPGTPARPGEHGQAILHDWGVDAALAARLQPGA